MKKLSAMALCLAVLGCAPAPEPVPAPVFRDVDAQIASQTDVSGQRLSGTWFVRQRFASTQALGDEIEINTLPDGALQMSYTAQACDQAPCERLVLLEQSGPARWMPRDAPADFPVTEIWVMWMDFDSRTAAIGTPSGQFGWIMDKNPTGGGDRIIAGRDIFEWFGYDNAQLIEVQQ